MTARIPLRDASVTAYAHAAILNTMTARSGYILSLGRRVKMLAYDTRIRNWPRFLYSVSLWPYAEEDE